MQCKVAKILGAKHIFLVAIVKNLWSISSIGENARLEIAHVVV